MSNNKKIQNAVEDLRLASWRAEIKDGIEAGRLTRYGRQVRLWSRDPPLDELRRGKQFKPHQRGPVCSTIPQRR